MFKIDNSKDTQSRLLISDQVFKNLVPDDSLLSQIDREYDFSVVDEAVKDLYCPDNGRPPVPPSILFKASVVQCLKRYSDVEMEYQATMNIEIKNFLGLDLDELGFDHSTLSVFRKRLGPERFNRLFKDFLLQLKEKDLNIDFGTQNVDSIPIAANAAMPSTTALIYQSLKRLMKQLKEKHGSIYDELLDRCELTEDKLEHYSKARPLFKLEDKERTSVFVKSVKRSRIIIERCRELDDPDIADEVEMLETILEQNVEDDEDEVKEREDKPTRPIKSRVDPDAKLGHKDDENTVFGYKGNITATKEGIITGVTTSTMADRDDSQLVPLVEEQEDVDLKAEKMNGDSGYGFIQDFVDMQEKGIELNAPMRGSKEHDEISVYDFEYDEERDVLICPMGMEGKRVGSKMRFEFPIRKCRCCPKADVCVPGNRSRRFTLDKNYELVMKLRQNRAERKERNKERLRIETLFAFLEKLGIKKARYRGINRIGIQLYITAITSNLVKTVRLKIKKEKEKIEKANKKVGKCIQNFVESSKSFLKSFFLSVYGCFHFLGYFFKAFTIRLVFPNRDADSSKIWHSIPNSIFFA
jgi:IS5 family transposase